VGARGGLVAQRQVVAGGGWLTSARVGGTYYLAMTPLYHYTTHSFLIRHNMLSFYINIL
jgi:hypothetical protein